MIFVSFKLKREVNLGAKTIYKDLHTKYILKISKSENLRKDEIDRVFIFLATAQKTVSESSVIPDPLSSVH